MVSLNVYPDHLTCNQSLKFKFASEVGKTDEVRRSWLLILRAAFEHSIAFELKLVDSSFICASENTHEIMMEVSRDSCGIKKNAK